MRLTRTIFGFAAAACFALAAPAYADSHGAVAHGKPTTAGKPTITTGKPTVSNSQTTHGKPTVSKSQSTHSTGKSTTTGKPTTTGKSSTKHSSSTTSTSTSSTSTTGSTTAGSGGTTTTLNPIAAKISSHPQLKAKITAMLPDGMSLNYASKGFRNQGQFIAALHVSQNLGIPFKDLKTDMTKKGMSLGQSIQDLKKSANSTTEATKGEREADEDVKSKTSTSTERESREESEHEHHLSIAQRISSNTQLNTKVTALLPQGTTLQQASRGFTSESQFLAALHASKDLNIPFSQIKAEMTGADHDSLLRAIQELKPTVDAAAAAKTAQTEAATDIKSTTTTTTHTDHDGDQ